MRRFPAFLVLFATLLAASPAAAQVNYNGWDLGPDYGKMLEEALRQDELFRQQLAAEERRITELAMADPLCQKLYGYHQQQGGQLPYPNFAYLCWATRHFTPEGIAYFQQTEQENWKREYLAAIDLRKMEAIRGQAQNDLNGEFQKNNVDLGAVIAGKNYYTDPQTGSTVELPNFTEPNKPYWDPASQAYYAVDTTGQVLQWHNNAWQTIQRQQRPPPLP